MSIKLKQPTMRLATFFLVHLVMRWNGHIFFNSLNKMTNAAYENAMRGARETNDYFFFCLKVLVYRVRYDNLFCENI